MDKQDKMSVIDYVIEAMKSGRSVIEIIKELRNKRVSQDEKWYIGELLRGYEHEKQTQELKQEYREGRQEMKEGFAGLRQEYREGNQLLLQEIRALGNHLKNLEQTTKEFYAKLEGFIEGVIVERKK